MRKGFTLIELLIYIAIFTIVMVAFTGMLISITQVQTQQTAENEVTSQSQFLLQQVQYYIGQSSLIDMPQDTATTTLDLRMANLSNDPTLITLSGGTVYLTQGNSAAQPLTSSKVTVSNLSFTKHSNAPGHDSASVTFTVAYNTSNPLQAFAQMFQTSVARVSASTFDSNLIPSTTNAWSLGLGTNAWTSVDGLINFNSGATEVAIGMSTPQSTLDVNGGVRMDPQTASRPTCTATIDGEFWVVSGLASSTSDTVAVCLYNGSGYAWHSF